MINLALLIPMFDTIEPGTQDFIDEVYNHPEFKVTIMKAKSSTIVGNRNRLLSRFLSDTDCEYALCLDTDNAMSIDDLNSMIAMDKPAVFGLYKNKFVEGEYLAGWYGYNEALYAYDGQSHLKTSMLASFPPLHWSGMGLCLLTRDCVKRLEYPYIAQPPVELIGGKKDVMLEDVYFCRKLLDEGIAIEIYISDSIKHFLRCEDKNVLTKLNQRVNKMAERVSSNCNNEIGSINMALAQMNSQYQRLIAQITSDQESMKEFERTIKELDDRNKELESRIKELEKTA